MKALLTDDREETGFRLNGRIVLVALIGFFVTVMGVNGLMAYLAVETFSGIQTEKPYENGLAFNREIARARAQESQGWKVEEHIDRAASGSVTITIHLHKADDTVITGLSLVALLKSPTNSRNDCKTLLNDQGDGTYTAVFPCGAGQWDLETTARLKDEVVYQSVNRIILH